MDRPPRDPKAKLITLGSLLKSVILGLVIFVAAFGAYIVYLQQQPDNAPLARTMGLTIMLLSNILLVQINSSNSEYAVKTFMRLAKDKVMSAVIVATLAGLLVMLYTPLCGFLKLAPLSLGQLGLAVVIALVAVLWYEFVKLYKVKLKQR